MSAAELWAAYDRKVAYDSRLAARVEATIYHHAGFSVPEPRTVESFDWAADKTAVPLTPEAAEAAEADLTRDLARAYARAAERRRRQSRGAPRRWRPRGK